MAQKIKVLLLATLVIILTCTVSINQVEAKSFPDLNKGIMEIEYLIEKGVISGYPNGTFRPNNQVTRAEATTMVGIGLKLDGTKRLPPFSDVRSTLFASGYIASAYEKSIISGYPDGTFKPNHQITRGEMAIIIAKAFNLTEQKKITYTDVPKGHPKYSAINLVASAGISSGYPDGSFKPNDYITREHVAILIARALNTDFRSSVTEDTYKGEVKYVSTDTLNVRISPNTSKDPIATLHKNDRVVTQQQIGEWFYVTSGSVKGYVHGDYLSDYKEETKYVTAVELNVRVSPDTTKAPIATLYKGDKVITQQQIGQWFYITTGNIKGYVHGDHLSDKKVSAKRIIAIDPGHGGSEPGSSGIGIIEKDLNLDVSLRVQKKLEKAGIKVVMTRTTDKTVALNDRVPLALKGNADTFVSIHSNAHPNTSANGTESFYSRAVLDSRAEDSKQLASLIQKRLLVALNTTNRGVKEMGFRVIKVNPLPAALIELGFITNTGDAAKLKQNVYKEKAADAIFLGIVDYYNWKER